MILKATHHPVIYPLFKMLTIWRVGHNFSNPLISGRYEDKGLPVLAIANHVSWWDGFWVNYLNMKTYRRKFHFMMLERQLEAFPVLRKTGGYSVRHGSISVIESLQYSAALLEDPRNMVLFFPQGRIESVYTSVFRFEKGIGRLLTMINNRVQVLFVANMVDYFSCSRPRLFIYFMEHDGEEHDAASIENAYNIFYSSCIREQQKKHDQ
jgi:hypothetical protein